MNTLTEYLVVGAAAWIAATVLTRLAGWWL